MLLTYSIRLLYQGFSTGLEICRLVDCTTRQRPTAYILLVSDQVGD